MGEDYKEGRFRLPSSRPALFDSGRCDTPCIRRNERCDATSSCLVSRRFLPPNWPAPVAAADTTADFYVAPDGKDTWSGRLAAAWPDGSDGPLATLAGARDAVRRLKEQGPLRKPVRVLLRGGTYAVSEPVVFFEGDSGTKQAPITYAAYPGEKPILSGGVPISGWRKAKGPLWTTTVPGVKEGGWYFRSLFVDGKRCTPARTPNEGSEFAADVIKPLHRSTQDDVVSSYGLRYHNEDIKPWSNLDDAVVVVYHAWTAARHCIASVDFAKKIVHFTNRGQFPVGWCAVPRYYVENVREALDAPGQFYLDRKTGLLTYYPRYPRPGEDMTKAAGHRPAAGNAAEDGRQRGRRAWRWNTSLSTASASSTPTGSCRATRWSTSSRPPS